MTAGLLAARTAGAVGPGGHASARRRGGLRRSLLGLAELVRWGEPWDVESEGEPDQEAPRFEGAR